MSLCLVLSPLFLILGSTVPGDDSDKVQYCSSNRVNNVFVNELFWGAKFDLSTYQIVFVVLELHMVETIITSTVVVKGLT